MLKNLNARLRIILVVLASTLPVLGLAVYGEYTHRSDAELDERTRLRLIAELTAKRPALVIEGARQLLFATAGNIDHLLSGRKECQAYLRRLILEQGQYFSVGLVLPDGKLYCASFPQESDVPVDVSDRLYFRQAAASGKFVIGEYQVGRLTRRQSINFGYPAVDAGNTLKAVLFVSLDLAAIVESRVSRETEAWQRLGGVVTVVDRNGIVLTQSPGAGAQVGEKFPDTQVLQKILSQPRGLFFADDPAGVKRIYAVEGVGENPDGIAPLRVIVSSPEALIYEELNRTLRRTILGAMLMIILMIVVAWVGTEMLVMRRFRVLLGVAERVRKGDFSARTGFGEGREEMTRLGHALDSMVEELQVRDDQLKRALRQLNEQASTDELTGLPNRRHLWDALDVELIRARRKQASLAVMMMDIEHFKKFNDRWGHDAGDLVLISVARELRKVVRGSDIVARHGGEEFVIVLPDATEQIARERAEALRAAIAALRLSYKDETLDAVTMSVGIAISSNAHESAEDLVRAADDAMYEAKRSGRDRVEVRYA